jgi:hypothetical protein
MTPEQIDRVFGRGRLKMVTGEHVEVFREAVAPGERRRYTKRFLSTQEGDYGQWTEREWRILARLIGHGITCVPDVVRFDRGRLGGMQLVQTYDAGATVDQWATLLPVTRDGRMHRHVFEDCAHWWALAHHCLVALNVIHALELVHLDIKGDNVCIPYVPANFDPDSSDLWLHPVFAQLALIDFAFALISRESLTTPLPIGWQKEYDYQSPRLLAALEAGRNGDLQLTRELDWRCDMYSLAAMLKRHLPDEKHVLQPACAGWTSERYDAARGFILRLRRCHDSDLPGERPHATLIGLCNAWLRDPELARSLERGWTLAREANASPASASPQTPVTRLAPPIRVVSSGRITAITVTRNGRAQVSDTPGGLPAPSQNAKPPRPARRARAVVALAALLALGALGAGLWYLRDSAETDGQGMQAFTEPIRTAASQAAETVHRLVQRHPEPASHPSPAATGLAKSLPPVPTTAAVPASSGSSGGSAPAPPAAASDRSIANAQAMPAGPAPREAWSVPPPRQPSTQAAKPWARNKSSAPSPPVQAGVPSRTTGKAAHAQTANVPSVSHPLPGSSATQPQRTHAWWASLEPPAWLHNGVGPGEPPGAKTGGRHAVIAASTEAAPAEPARSAVTPAPAADSPRVAAGVSDAPILLPGATSTGSDQRRAPLAAATAQAAPAALSAAPPEKRNEDFALTDQSAAPGPITRAVAAEQGPAVDLAAQGRRTLMDTVPRIAGQADPEVRRVLLLAASAYQPLQERAVADAARLAWVADDATLRARVMAPSEARRLSDQARIALGSRRNVFEAMGLQLGAFGANPRDPEVASYLASLYLKVQPPQPETARQIVLLALTARGAQFHLTRMEDWTTLAISNALTGRDVDARNALFVTLAVSGNVEQTCVSALSAFANYGERLRGPVEALLYRIRAQGRGYESAACAWPPNWWVLSRLP